MPGRVSMRTLYARPGLITGPAAGCAVLHVTPLLRELMIETVRLGQLKPKRRYDSAFLSVLIAQIRKASSVPTFVALPQEPRSLAVAEAVLRDLTASKTVAKLCAESGVGVRTFERSFRKDVGIDFESWRRQVRLIKAVQHLVSGCSIKETAFKVGYHQSSTLVEIFRQTFGTTPKNWVDSLGDGRTAF